MNPSESSMAPTRRGPFGRLGALAMLLGCVLDIRLGDDSGDENAAGRCGSEERLAVAYTVDVGINWHPAVWTIDDWWFVYPGSGPSYAISRCADEIITLPERVLLTPIPGEPSALYCRDGLRRIDLAEGGRVTRLDAGAGNGSVWPFDGVGGVFFTKESNKWHKDKSLKGEVNGEWREVWRATDLITPMASVRIHPSALGPYEMADGWYLYTSEESWSRIDLSTNTLVPIHPATEFIVPNRSGDAWVWGDATVAEEIGLVESFVHHLDRGEDVPIGLVQRTNPTYPVGIDWNEAGTHMVLHRRVFSDGFLMDVFEFVGIDANTGVRSPPLVAEDGWTQCNPWFAETYGQGFLLCRTEEGSYDTDYYFFDPATGQATLLQDEDLIGPGRPGWMEDDKGYYPLTDGRYITGQSLPGYPQVEDFPSIDRLQMFLVDHERDMRHPLMTMYPSDAMTVSLDNRLIAYTDASRDGFYIRPLP
jgi:hypothetical protein